MATCVATCGQCESTINERSHCFYRLTVFPMHTLPCAMLRRLVLPVRSLAARQKMIGGHPACRHCTRCRLLPWIIRRRRKRKEKGHKALSVGTSASKMVTVFHSGRRMNPVRVKVVEVPTAKASNCVYRRKRRHVSLSEARKGQVRGHVT